jgi:hypothetical protein
MQPLRAQRSRLLPHRLPRLHPTQRLFGEPRQAITPRRPRLPSRKRPRPKRRRRLMRRQGRPRSATTARRVTARTVAARARIMVGSASGYATSPANPLLKRRGPRGEGAVVHVTAFSAFLPAWSLTVQRADEADGYGPRKRTQRCAESCTTISPKLGRGACLAAAGEGRHLSTRRQDQRSWSSPGVRSLCARVERLAAADRSTPGTLPKRPSESLNDGCLM